LAHLEQTKLRSKKRGTVNNTLFFSRVALLKRLGWLALAGGVLLLCIACSPAEEWIPVPNGKPGELVNVRSIAVTGTIRRASIKLPLASRAPWDTSPEDRRVTEILVRQTYDCAQRKQKNESVTLWYMNGVVFHVPADKLPPHDWKPVSADDGEAELEVVCTWKNR
jgi:hypothetical protein